MIARNKRRITLKDFYYEFLQHTSNSMMSKKRRLTDMETKVLTEFWILEGDLVDKYRFAASAKRYVREDVFGFKNYSNLENYLAKLVSKGYLIKEENTLKIRPELDLPKDKLREEGKFVLMYEFDILK